MFFSKAQRGAKARWCRAPSDWLGLQKPREEGGDRRNPSGRSASGKHGAEPPRGRSLRCPSVQTHGPVETSRTITWIPAGGAKVGTRNALTRSRDAPNDAGSTRVMQGRRSRRDEVMQHPQSPPCLLNRAGRRASSSLFHEGGVAYRRFEIRTCRSAFASRRPPYT